MTGVLVTVALVLTLLNLVLLLGVVRRLRDHETRLASRPSDGMPELIAPTGSRVGAFASRSVDGRPVDNGSLTAPTLVGFFSPGCDACHEQLPDFRRAAAEHSGGVLAVVVQDGKDPDPLVAELDGSATVVLEQPGGSLMESFAVRGFPAFAVVGADGTVTAGGFELPLQRA